MAFRTILLAWGVVIAEGLVLTMVWLLDLRVPGREFTPAFELAAYVFFASFLLAMVVTIRRLG